MGDEFDAGKVARIFDALGNESRRRILDLLTDEPLTSGEVAAWFGCSWAATSRHIRVLRAAGLVKAWENEMGGRDILMPDLNALQVARDWLKEIGSSRW